MSEERWSGGVPSRRPEETPSGSGGVPGAGSGPALDLPRQADQAAPWPGPGGGGRRRRAAAPEFGPQELSAALHQSVSPVGAGGPPRAGMARIRRRAKTRQRRRTVVAGSAGVLFLAMAVSVAAGDSFDLVPVLTGVVGLGHSDASSSGSGSGSDGLGRVRTVLPPADAAGKKGPAIGPIAPASVSTALAAAGVPVCTPVDLTTVTTVDSVSGGVSYGHVEAVAQRSCAVAGPPVLQVENAAGTAVSSIVILQHVATDGSTLPNVPTWGTVLKLQPGQGYDFQFAWAPDACAGTGASGSGGSTAAPGSDAAASGAGASSAAAYTLSYLIEGTMPTEPVDLTAACGATVYVTDIYGRGGYPLPKPQGSASTPPSASAPATTPSPAPPPQSTTAPPSTTAGTVVAPSTSADPSSPDGSGPSPSTASSAAADSAASQPTSS